MIPCEIIQADRFLSAAFEHVRKNGILMMTGDGTGRGESIGRFAEFTLLGRKKPFPLGPARLALKTGASIIPMFTVKEEEGIRFVTRLEEPIVSAAQSSTTGEEEITARFVQAFEAHLKKYPCHWHFWDEFPGSQPRGDL
jgi:KDO2-lipid IV(A) lauroyltransferase